MLASLPQDAIDLMAWTWPEIEPHYSELEAVELSTYNVDAFVARWSAVQDRLHESYARRYVATTVNTEDERAERLFQTFLDEIYPRVEQADQRLKEKLLASGLEPQGFSEPLRKMRAEASLYREENIPLSVENNKLANEYNRIMGSQTVDWNGEDVPIARIQAVLQDPHRETRERAWNAMSQRQLRDRTAIEDLWTRMFELRTQMAANAQLDNYRTFRWQELLRLDYTAEDAERFHRAIEEVVAPAVRRLHSQRREMLGVETLRPWDLTVDPLERVPLKPFDTVENLVATTSAVFRRVDPTLGGYFDRMRDEDALDLDSRKNKAPGGFCIPFPLSRKPFIFMNSVGVQRDVETILHEGGHAFHDYEMWKLPYAQQRSVAIEFAEIASMAMEFLASPYLAKDAGGFYSRRDAARARRTHLEQALTLWLTVATVDMFQHWAYLNPAEAADPRKCGEKWMTLRRRYLPEVDYSGLEAELEIGWLMILHIHTVPFYMIEYGLAQLGAVQIWAHSLQNQAGAVERYREALALGGTRPLPELFAAAGARLAFDSETLGASVSLMEATIESLNRSVA